MPGLRPLYGHLNTRQYSAVRAENKESHMKKLIKQLKTTLFYPAALTLALLSQLMLTMPAQADDIFKGYIPCAENGTCGNTAGETPDQEVGCIGCPLPIYVIPEEDDSEDEVLDDEEGQCSAGQPTLSRVFVPLDEADQTPDNCSEIGCRGSNLVLRPDNRDISEDAKVCNICLDRALAVDPSKEGQPTAADKCVICQNGEAVDLEYDKTPVTNSIAFNGRNPTVNRIVTPITSALSRLGLGNYVKFGEIAGMEEVSDCCNPTIGFVENGLREVSGGISIEVDVDPSIRLIPPVGSPIVTEFGFKKRFAEVRFKVGVYLAGEPPSFTISGGRIINQCNGDVCDFASGSLATGVKLSAIAEGYACVNIGPVDGCAGLSLELGISAPLSGTLTVNKPCGEGLVGQITAGPVSVFIKGGVGLPAEGTGSRSWPISPKFEWPDS